MSGVSVATYAVCNRKCIAGLSRLAIKNSGWLVAACRSKLHVSDDPYSRRLGNKSIEEKGLNNMDNGKEMTPEQESSDAKTARTPLSRRHQREKHGLLLQRLRLRSRTTPLPANGDGSRHRKDPGSWRISTGEFRAGGILKAYWRLSD